MDTPKKPFLHDLAPDRFIARWTTGRESIRVSFLGDRIPSTESPRRNALKSRQVCTFLSTLLCSEYALGSPDPASLKHKDSGSKC
jgi:hypothetical protein